MPSNSNLSRVLERFKAIAQNQQVEMPDAKFKRYAISNFRGGIGKTTVAFNLAWEVSRVYKTLCVDVCPQTNFSQTLLGDEQMEGYSVYDAILPMLIPGSPKIELDELLTAVSPYCAAFKGGKSPMAIKGAKELFLLPSLLYSQLNTTSQLPAKTAQTTSKNILESLSSLFHEAETSQKFQKVVIDTSPFFGGATHLAWIAADALIIPVRVDQNSIDSLKLTLSMLKNAEMDFLRLNGKAEINKIPKIHAIVMTHCGWNRQSPFTPDRSTQAYLEQALGVIQEHAALFSDNDPVKCLHLLDDFHSAGRISGTQRTPLAKLTVGDTFVIEGQRLKVNISLTRYQNEIKALAQTL